MSRDQRQILSKFRSCNLPLAIETGRFTKSKTPLKDRICKFWSASSVEGETHFLIECEFYDDIRYDLFESTSKLNDNFGHLNPKEKLSFLMNTNSLQFNIVNCLLTMSRRKRQNFARIFTCNDCFISILHASFSMGTIVFKT